MSVVSRPEPPSFLGRALQARTGWRLALLVLCAVLCWLAFSPVPPERLSTGWDKLNHAIAFAALTVTSCLAYPRPWRALWPLLLAVLAFGGFIEVVQAFVPGRSSEWQDLLADGAGIVAGAILVLPLLRAALERR